MGDRSVRWALQQTHLSAVAQIILVRLCKDLDDREDVWVFRRSRARISVECNISDGTLKRHLTEMGSGIKPVLFRGVRPGRVNEYVILGPNRGATARYLESRYPAHFGPPPKWTDSMADPVQIGPHPAHFGPPNKEIEGSLCKNSLHSDSPRPVQGELSEIWEAAQPEIQKQINPHSYAVWVKPARPLGIRGDVFLFSVPTPDFVWWLQRKKNVFIDAVRVRGAPVREMNFIVQPS